MLFPQAGLVDPSYNAARVFGAANSPFYTDGRVMYPPNFSWGAGSPTRRPTWAPSWRTSIRPRRLVQPDEADRTAHAEGRRLLEPRLQGPAARHCRCDAVPGRAQLRQRHAEPARQRLRLCECRARRPEPVCPAVRRRGRRIHLQQRRWVPAGQLEGERQADPGLRLRFVYMQPTYDTRIQASTFFLDQWQGHRRRCSIRRGAQARVPAPAPTVRRWIPAAGSSSGRLRRAHRADRAELGQPDERDRARRRRHLQAQLHVAGRRGRAALRLAYDVSGTQRMVVRGGIGLFHDRPAGDTMASQVGNPGFRRRARCATRCCRQPGIGLEILGPPQLTSVWPTRRTFRRPRSGTPVSDDAAVGVDHRRLVCRQHGFNQLAKSADRPRSTSMPWTSTRRSCRRTRTPRSPRAARPARLRIRPTCCGPTAASARSGSTS